MISGPLSYRVFLETGPWAGLFESRITLTGLKVNQSINFSCLKMFFIAYALCSLRLVKLKTERQNIKTEKLTEKLQN